MHDSDQQTNLETSATPLTGDFIGLCIGILSVVLVILIVAICKWSRCQCLKHQNDVEEHNEVFTSILHQNASTPHPFSNHHLHQPNRHRHHHRSSSCDQRPTALVGYQPVSTVRDDFLSPVPPAQNGYRLNDIKVPRVTITTLPVQPTQQLVPRLSISPQVSGSSIAHSTYSLKQ